MIKRILVAIDGSPSTDAALTVAGSLCGIIRAELIGLFVEEPDRPLAATVAQAIDQTFAGEPSLDPFVPEPSRPAPAPPSAGERAKAFERTKLERMFHDRMVSLRVENQFVALSGAPDVVIREWAKTVDFIVLGSGEGGKEGSRRGADTMVLTLLRSVARPVLVVPAESAGDSRIVVAYDGSLAADRALRAAAEFAEIADFESLHLLTVAGNTDDARTTQAPALKYLSAYNVEVQAVCFSGKPDQVILQYVAEVDASVLALGAFGSNRLKEAIFGSTTESVLRDAETAVLLVS